MDSNSVIFSHECHRPHLGAPFPLPSSCLALQVVGAAGVTLQGTNLPAVPRSWVDLATQHADGVTSVCTHLAYGRVYTDEACQVAVSASF